MIAEDIIGTLNGSDYFLAVAIKAIKLLQEEALKEGFKIAKENVEIFHHDGWTWTGPTADFEKGKQILNKKISG